MCLDSFCIINNFINVMCEQHDSLRFTELVFVWSCDLN